MMGDMTRAQLRVVVAELEAKLEDRDATIAAYRRRELNQQAALEDMRRAPVLCADVSAMGAVCELDKGHDGSHRRKDGNSTWRWGG